MDINKLMLQAIPRRTVSEKCFRKYELDIARACHASCVIKPSRKATSYVHGVTEAMLGYRQYNYISQVIPQGYDVRHIRAIPLADGTVLLRNIIADAASQPMDFRCKVFSASDRTAATAIINKLGTREIEGPVQFRVDSDEDILFIRSHEDGTRDISIDTQVINNILKVF